MAIRRFTCLISKATDTHSEYEIFIAFPQQQWLPECASMLHYMCTAYLVCILFTSSRYFSPYLDTVWFWRPRNQVFEFWQSQNKNTNIIVCLNCSAVSKAFIFWLKFTFYGTGYTATQQSGIKFTPCIFYARHSTYSKQQFFTSDIFYSSLFYFIIQPWVLTKNCIIFKLWSDFDTF